MFDESLSLCTSPFGTLSLMNQDQASAPASVDLQDPEVTKAD